MMIPDFFLAALAWICASLFLLGLALVVSAPLRFGRRRIDGLVLGFAWIFLVTLVVLLAGLLGLLHRLPLFLASAFGLVAGAAAHHLWAAHPANPWSRLVEAFEALRRTRWSNLAAPDPWIVVLSIPLALQAARFGAHVWILPPYDWDVLTYHLPKVAEWVQQACLTIPNSPIPRMAWPAHHELFQTWFVVFFRHDVFFELADLCHFALATGSVFALARGLGSGRRSSFAAAVLFASTPAVGLHATAGKNDLAIAALYLFSLALLVDGLDHSAEWRRRWVLLGLVGGLAIGIKATFVFLLPGILWIGWKEIRRAPGRLREAVTGSAEERLDLRFLVSAGFVALFAASFWYLRNLWVYGNPFYPVSFELFGFQLGDEAEGRQQLGTFSWEALRLNLDILLTEKIDDSMGTFSVSLTSITGWGWFTFAVGWPALGWALISDRRIRWLAVGFLLSLVGLFSAVSPDPWNMRFALWFPALPAIAYVATISRLRAPAFRGAIHGLAALCVLANLVGTLQAGHFSPPVWRHMASLPVAERSTANLRFLIGPTYREALSTVPRNEVLAYDTGPNGWIYPLYDADLSQRICFVPVEDGQKGAATRRAMEACDARFLFVARPFSQGMPALEETLRRRGFRQIQKGLFVARDDAGAEP